jgi:molybdopterin/thiamine biosynthesis adenylyltransferase
MSTLKFTNPNQWDLLEDHLEHAVGERFAFAFTRVLYNGATGPILEVVDVTLIVDEDVEHDGSGWYLSDSALDRVHNQAIVAHVGLAEFHNHWTGPPRFSQTDERGLEPMANYMLDLLPGQPYVAAVWADGQLHAEWWRTGSEGGTRRGPIDTVTVIGDHLLVLNAPTVHEERFNRQLPLINRSSQAAIAALRVAIIGAGGTGSHVLTQLAYLGFRNLLVLDDDEVETTNLNRLVIAEPADIGIAKTIVAKRRVRSIDPRIAVTPLPGITFDGEHPELFDVDLIIGCVDHDGPRQRLNQIAVDTRTPYLDIATGVDDSATPPLVGGRVIFTLPGAPCLMCVNELDPVEVSRWAKSANQQQLDREHGYGTGAANPSVVHLNAITVSAAVTEVMSWITGGRAPARWLDIDLVGNNNNPGTLIGPRRLLPPDQGCIACGRQLSDVASDNLL